MLPIYISPSVSMASTKRAGAGTAKQKKTPVKQKAAPKRPVGKSRQPVKSARQPRERTATVPAAGPPSLAPIPLKPVRRKVRSPAPACTVSPQSEQMVLALAQRLDVLEKQLASKTISPAQKLELLKEEHTVRSSLLGFFRIIACSPRAVSRVLTKLKVLGLYALVLAFASGTILGPLVRAIDRYETINKKLIIPGDFM